MNSSSCNCQSDQEKVNEFTTCVGTKIPNSPCLMSRDDVIFLTRMALSEIQELVDTVTESNEESLELMKQCLGVDPSKHRTKELSEVELIAEQGDACVDCWYYMLNVAGRHGHNLSALFDVVHNANMAKRDPETGEFIRRESDGKILKPKGWQPPNLVAEMYRQGYTDPK